MKAEIIVVIGLLILALIFLCILLVSLTWFRGIPASISDFIYILGNALEGHAAKRKLYRKCKQYSSWQNKGILIQIDLTKEDLEYLDTLHQISTLSHANKYIRQTILNYYWLNLRKADPETLDESDKALVRFVMSH